MCSLSPRATLFPYTTLFRSQVRSDGAGPGCAEVNVGRLPTHGGQQPCFVAFAWELVQLDARAVRREPPYEPDTVHPDARIGTANAVAQDRVIVDLLGQGSECLGLPRDPPPTPRGERDEPLAPQAPESGDAMNDPRLESALGEGPSERGQHGGGDGGLHRRKRLELVPKRLRIVQAIQCHLAQRGVMLRQHERVSPMLEGLPVAVE